jgi:hypothetical protein
MASEVDICNLGLAHFGQDASIDSIDPPDTSAEAEHAARFYPIARDELLEMHPWSFAKKRATLAELINDRSDWTYRYAVPTGCIKPRIVLPAGYGDEEVEGEGFDWEQGSIYTDVPNAILVFTFKVTDPTKFTPMFTTALSWRVAAYMSGPIIKDPTGRIQAALFQRSLVELAKATGSNANASRSRATHTATARRVR